MGKLKKQPKNSNTESEIKKMRPLRLTDKVWGDFQKLKSRNDKSWDLFLKELIEHLNHIKNL